MTDAPNLYSPHAEESLVGAALIAPQILDTVDVKPDDFHVHSLRYIWQALHDLRAQSIGIDFVTVGNALATAGHLDEIGGPAYLAKLINDTPTAYGAADYAVIIRDNANRRRVLQSANDLARFAMDRGTPLDESVSHVMTDLVQSAGTGDRAEHWGKYLGQAHALAEARMLNPKGTWGIKTGFTDYDYVSGGLQLGELMLLTGEPGVGKSIFVTQMAMQLATTSPGAIYSLEMMGGAVALRAISARAKIPTRDIKSGTVGDSGWMSFVEAVGYLDSLPIYMSDNENWTTTAMRSDLARLKRDHGVQWFIVDYSYLLRDGGDQLNETERTQIVIANLKRICKALELAGVAIHSMTKAGMMGEISQASLRGSGQNQYDADVIIGLTVPDKQQPDVIRVSMLKGREIEKKGTFDMIRLNGIPWYERAETHAVDLNGKAR